MSVLDFLKRLFGRQADDAHSDVADQEPAPQVQIYTDADAYADALREVLEDAREAGEEQLCALLAALPDGAERLDIGIHTDQDQDGFVTVTVHPAGPDAHALNTSVAPHRTLFESKIIDGRMVPAMPAVNAFGADFPTAEVIFAVASSWVLSIWDAVGGAGSGKGGQIFLADEFGESPPRSLP